MNQLKLFGKRIKELRKKSNLTQEQLAEKIGVFQKQIGNIETGTCFTTFPTLEKLANIFGVELDDLFKISHHKDKTELIKDINLMISNADEHQLSIIHRLIKDIIY